MRAILSELTNSLLGDLFTRSTNVLSELTENSTHCDEMSERVNSNYYLGYHRLKSNTIYFLFLDRYVIFCANFVFYIKVSKSLDICVST